MEIEPEKGMLEHKIYKGKITASYVHVHFWLLVNPNFQQLSEKWIRYKFKILLLIQNE